MHKIPVLISPGINRMAKYTERNGFLLNHLYDTLTAASSISSFSSFTPAKNAAGTFTSKNEVKAKVLPNFFLNVGKLEVNQFFLKG